MHKTQHVVFPPFSNSFISSIDLSAIMTLYLLSACDFKYGASCFDRELFLRPLELCPISCTYLVKSEISYFNKYPLHVSSRLTAHHQEVLLCIYSSWRIVYQYTNCCVYRVALPDDEQWACWHMVYGIYQLLYIESSNTNCCIYRVAPPDGEQ